jgi:hypothetical protein
MNPAELGRHYRPRPLTTVLAGATKSPNRAHGASDSGHGGSYRGDSRDPTGCPPTKEVSEPIHDGTVTIRQASGDLHPRTARRRRAPPVDTDLPTP